jgi:hypothetical protein
MKYLRRFSGTNSARKIEARVRADVVEALDCGLTPNLAAKLNVRGKRTDANLPDFYDDVHTNKGHGQNYGPKKKRKYNKDSIRYNKLDLDDYYDEEELE